MGVFGPVAAMRRFFRGWQGRSQAADEVLRMRRVVDALLDLVMVVDPDLRLRYVSPSCERMLGWAPEELIGTDPRRCVHPDDFPMIAAATRRKRDAIERSSRLTYRMIRRDGTHIWVEAFANATFDPVTGGLDGIVVVARDVTEHVEHDRELAAMAMTDALTGLANRRAFDDALEREWQNARHAGTQISLLLIDLDHFKGFNDRYGHQAGDDCLRVAAAAIRGGLSHPGDLAARYGGEEFAVILPQADLARAVAVAERLRTAIEALGLPHQDNPGGNITASFGAATAVARAGGSQRMPEALLLAADGALYKAKNGGRNQVGTAVLFAPDDGSRTA